jgi:hypothetical protein
MLYYATDTGLLTRGDGSAWELIGLDTLNARIVSGEIPITLAMPTAPAAPDPPAARNAPRERA